MIYWCESCGIPYHDHGAVGEYCPICSYQTFVISKDILVPVFLQEKRLLSYIINQDITKENVWYKGNAYYVINGEAVRIPYVEYYKNKGYDSLDKEVRENIVLDDGIHNEEAFLKANEMYLTKIVYDAERYVEYIADELRNDHIPVVSYSGGKDSTVVSRIVMDALQRNDIIHFFGNTTLELPATYNHCNNVFRRENKFTPLLETKSDKDFFKLCDYLGPPSRLERWCCTIFKTSNINYFIQALPKGYKFLSFMGIRKRESNNRKNYTQTQYESKISNQVVAMPIIDWSDFDVWLYIRYKKLPFNDAYKLGYRRVGCWCCPNNSQWSELLTAIYYPELHAKWQRVLFDFAKKTNKADVDDYIHNNKWKARRGASGLENRNVNILNSECFLHKNTSNFILDKPIKTDFIELLKPFGKLKILNIGDNYTIEAIDGDKKSFKINFKIGSKILKVGAYDGYDKVLLNLRLKCQIRKYQFCIHCSACDALCPEMAISTLNGKYVIDEEKCENCKTCISKFYNGCLTTEVLSAKKTGGAKSEVQKF